MDKIDKELATGRVSLELAEFHVGKMKEILDLMKELADNSMTYYQAVTYRDCEEVYLQTLEMCEELRAFYG